ncbi:uncharacterized protein LOC111694452 [Trichogramma pretiosum]|uniref:uncharacterized protein LOC111694452 n=1 Tax=Trichogramma pretiosum TaxID=7493 RepID=UPI000C71A8ED|nr:uncharacterized protein LOC111694452 [Trichogramma pretiosum]
MKFTIALVALFLVCAAQARAVEDDDKEQLHVFVDHLEATVKPALTKTYHEVEKIKSDMENAKKETIKILDVHEEDVIASLHPVGSIEMQTLVDRLKIDWDDQFACESKMIQEVFKCGAIMDVHYQCMEVKSSKSLQTLNQAL